MDHILLARMHLFKYQNSEAVTDLIACNLIQRAETQAALLAFQGAFLGFAFVENH